MAKDIYRKPIMFAVVAAMVILIGTIVTMFAPMFTKGMHPKLERLKPYTPLLLAGKDIYQREGCNNCHTQTVRPLKTEVMRYGEYSKAGEFTYDRPFLWGSKRTGPDLARIGSKYPDAWHYMHFENPRDFFPESNMPAYGWLKDRKIDAPSIESHMKAQGFSYDPSEIDELKEKNELDAIVAYLQSVGTAVAKKEQKKEAPPSEEANPLAGDSAAIHRGEELYEANCAMCHGEYGAGGDIGPSLADDEWLGIKGDISDGKLFAIIARGTDKGMPPFDGSMQKDAIWSLVSFIRSIPQKK